MIQCPECRNLIPDDSIYCDQCGKQLHWCPECNKPKRGTICPVCGSELQTRQNTKRPGSPTKQAPTISGTGNSQAGSCLVGSGLKLMLKEGEFGRTRGLWPELSAYQYVSGRHGIIGRDGRGWTITDVGSTNGTWVAGQRLATGVATPFKVGDMIRIATYDFKVE